MPDTTDPNDKSSCPVDSSTRSRWSSLFGARPSPPEMESCPVDSAARSKWLSQQSLSSLASQHSTPEKSCDSNTLLAGSISSSTPQTIVPRILNTAREVSTIPRGSSAGSNSEHGPLQSHPLSDISKSNNWIYPSEAMFFAAMKRKSYDPNAADMRTIVPIHNAVNERAWQEIKEWEMGRGSEKYLLNLSHKLLLLME
jgi:cytochrome c heme-lyase